MKYGFKIIPVMTKPKHGKRARRMAFYNAARIARLLRRACGNESLDTSVVLDAWRDALVYGSGWYELAPDGRGMRRVAPCEFYT